jgi:AcrR family transcriptional regulator
MLAPMGRWEPDARGRLDKAAMELFRDRGYDRTTVADIAARAGLTERTFFRYYADKREVLFGGAHQLEELLVAAVEQQSRAADALEAVGAALESTGPLFKGRYEFARARQALIAQHADLHERELIKLATLAAAIAQALRRRGVKDPAASLAAEAGVAVFKIGFQRWLDDTRRRAFAHHIREALAELQAVTGARKRRR